jgi:FdhD protein
VDHCSAGIAGRSTNVIKVELASGVHVDLKSLERHFYTTSSCGICGKASIDAVQLHRPSTQNSTATANRISASVIHGLPLAVRNSQDLFTRTGGLHAAAIFDFRGELLLLREDVGRHNAVDKLIGAMLMARNLPASGKFLMLSGRASFELVQKAAMASIEVVAAVGAPSSLAVKLAEESGITLLGFVRDGRFNVYCGGSKVSMEELSGGTGQ